MANTENLTDLVNGGGISDERCEDHVNSLLNTEEKVRLVLLRNSWQIDIGARQVDSLFASQFTAIFNFTDEMIASWKRLINTLTT